MWKSCFLLFTFTLFHLCFTFPVDLTSVSAGQFNSLWLVTSPVLAVAFLLIIVGFLFGCVCCRTGKGFEEFRNSTGGLSIVETGDGFVNPTAAVSELTIFPPNGVTLVPVPESNNAVIRQADVQAELKVPNLRPATFSYGDRRDLSAQDWFYDPHLNFPRNQLRYVEECGRGWFGRIVEGEATFIDKATPKAKVFVKILHEDATPTDQMFFLHEVKWHRDLDHPNILKLLGRCLETEPFLLLLEHCPNGDLKTFLTSNTSSAYALAEQSITLRMALDITSGLDYMHQHKFIHTDLATRNCLVTQNLSIKIGDYGNAIELHPSDYYIAGSVALPVRWCAPETLKCTDVTIETKEVNAMANVWTLAVVFWEIFEFGKLPYTLLSDDEVIVKVLGERTVTLPTPELFSPYKDEMYHLMKLCWNPPLQRPNVSQIKAIIENLVSCGKTLENNNITLDFDQRWQQSKPNTIPITDNTVESKSSLRSARVADSHIESPLGVFMAEKQTGSDPHRVCLKRSDSIKNLSGSKEDLNVTSCILDGEEELDSWLKGVEVENDEDKNVVRGISEVIRDLDAALALEKTSSSEEASGISSKQSSPGKEITSKPVVDFHLGANTSSFMAFPTKSFELSSLQNTVEPQSLNFSSFIFPEVQDDSTLTVVADVEDEFWRKRIEDGEFTEKVKEKSKSIADLMVLTHISDDSDGSEKGFDRNINRNSFHRKLTGRPSISSINFGSETDIRNAVLETEFTENLKKLSQDHREFGKFDSLSMILPGRDFLFKSIEKDDFLCNVASEINDNNRLNECASSQIPEIRVEEIPMSPVPSPETTIQFDYPFRHFRFVLKDEQTVVLGANEDHTLRPYQGLKTHMDSWNEHIDTTFHKQYDTINFDDITFSSQLINNETNLENVWTDSDEKLIRTPDDERSSDSGFRDKGSLSESVEDACEGKYNLEDIEAELEESYAKDTFNETKVFEQETEFWKPKESEYYTELTESSPSDKTGWYLEPPDEKSDFFNDPDEDDVNALRNELLEKLPSSLRSFEDEEENNSFDAKCAINITYPKPLEPILEDPTNPTIRTPRKSQSSNLMESVKQIDNETFRNYLEFMVENEGKCSDLDEDPRSLLIYDDLEINNPLVVPETKPDDDLLLVNTVTNEATLLESPRPKSHVAFADFSSPEISLNEASTEITSSPDLLSDFLLTPDESPRTVPGLTKVEKFDNHSEAKEILHALAGCGIKPVQEEDKNLSNISTSDLLSKSVQKLETFEMCTSFMGDEGSEDEKKTTEEQSYTPDWEDSGDDETSSSGEFIWKDGNVESKLKVQDAVCPDIEISLFESSTNETRTNTELSQDAENDDLSVSSDSSASITDFVPSAWNSLATPGKSVLKDPNRKTEKTKRNVWFKREKYHCVYEYPREPSDVEDTCGVSANPIFDYSQYQDWDVSDTDHYPDLDFDTDDTDSSEAGKTDEKKSSYHDFYTLSPMEDFLAGSGPIGEDGEFFVSSSTRPFHVNSYFTGSQFTAFQSNPHWHQTSPTKDNILDDFTTPDSGVEDLSVSIPSESKSDDKPQCPNTKIIDYAPKGKRSTREHLTLDLPVNHNVGLAGMEKVLI